MSWEEIENRLNAIAPYALYVAIQTGLNMRMDQDKMFRVARHPIIPFSEFTDKDAGHYNYVRSTIPADIKRNEERIGLIFRKNDTKISQTSQEQCVVFYKRKFAGIIEVVKRFLKHGRIQLYWYST